MLAKTKVVVLGTGTPIPDAHRAGPSIAVIHKGNAYLFDAGAGAVRQATIARYLYEIQDNNESLETKIDDNQKGEDEQDLGNNKIEGQEPNG